MSLSCIARNVEQISYRVNETTATDKEVVDKGFVEHIGENLGNALRRRNLTVIVSSDHNNTKIYCRGIGTDTIVSSKTSTLTVQGKIVISQARLYFIVWGWRKRVWYNLIQRYHSEIIT